MNSRAYELIDVCRTYPGTPPVHALRSVSLVIDHGDYVAIMGKSGSGKSTLLNMLGLLDVPTSGNVVVNGTNCASLTDAQRTDLRRQYIGFIFQSFHLMEYRSAAQNVALGLKYRGYGPSARARLALDALGQVGLTDKSHVLPSRLSGGERQRVAIARALAVSPKLLLCDEPTGNLDSDSANAVLCLIDEVNEKGLTVIIVTHDDEVAAHARRRLHASDGTVTELPRAGA